MLKKVILSSFIVIAFACYIFVSHQANNTTDASASTSSATSASASSPTGASATSAASYKDGAYTGNAADAFYGNIQVQAVVQNGQLTAVRFLQYPNDRRTSQEINQQAMPLLQQEAIAAQSGQVDIVTGATDSSEAFRQSLTSALEQARA